MTQLKSFWFFRLFYILSFSDIYDPSTFPVNGSSLDCLSLIVQNLNRNCNLSQFCTISKMAPTSGNPIIFSNRSFKNNYDGIEEKIAGQRLLPLSKSNPITLRSNPGKTVCHPTWGWKVRDSDLREVSNIKRKEAATYFL